MPIIKDYPYLKYMDHMVKITNEPNITNLIPTDKYQISESVEENPVPLTIEGYTIITPTKERAIV